MTSRGYKAIILDFDGVLVESNHIKDRAFEAVFADHPTHLASIIAYHHATTAIRFEKFKYVYEHILKLPYSDAVEQRLGYAFSRFCVSQVSTCPQVAGADAFLQHFHGRTPLFLVTINPKADLDIILEKRDLKKYFKAVYPVTGSKRQAIDDIIKNEGIDQTQAVFIGDSQGDADSARAAGVDFIGRKSTMTLSQVPVVFDDMRQILDYLKGAS